MLWFVLWVGLGGVGVVEIWTVGGCGECLQAFVTLGNFVATQVDEKLPSVTYPATEIPRNIFVAAIVARRRNQLYFGQRVSRCCK